MFSTPITIRMSKRTVLTRVEMSRTISTPNNIPMRTVLTSGRMHRSNSGVRLATSPEFSLAGQSSTGKNRVH